MREVLIRRCGNLIKCEGGTHRAAREQQSFRKTVELKQALPHASRRASGRSRRAKAGAAAREQQSVHPKSKRRRS